MPKLNAKFMEEGLKKNWTTVEFCESLNMTEEELISNINKAFTSRAATNYLRKLKKNVKKPLTKKSSKTTFVLEPTDLKETISTATDSQDNLKVTPKISTEELTAEEIQADIQSLNQMIISFESTKKDILSENSVLKEQLQEKITEFAELRSKMQSLIDVSNNIKDQISSNLKKVDKIKEDISSLLEGRKNLEIALKELQKVTLLLNDDGSIEPDIEIPDSWENVYQHLFKGTMGYNDLIDQLTRAQIKQIAKVISYSANTDMPYEYITDNAVVEQLLNIFIK